MRVDFLNRIKQIFLPSKMKASTFLFFISVHLISNSQNLNFFIEKGISEQIEFNKPKNPYHGQVLSLMFKNQIGFQLEKNNSIFLISYVHNSVDIPTTLRYLNSESTRNSHDTSPENIMNQICLGYGKILLAKPNVSIDILSGINLGFFNKDIKSFKKPSSPPSQRTESINEIISSNNSSLIYSSFSMGYFTNKANFTIPVKIPFSFYHKRIEFSLIPFFELGLNTYHKMTLSYYIPNENVKGYSVSKSNGTNYGLSFRISCMLFKNIKTKKLPTTMAKKHRGVA